jgi:hypothetical protein
LRASHRQSAGRKREGKDESFKGLAELSEGRKPGGKAGEAKAFYTLNEPENIASYWAVVDGDLFAWLEENERTVEEVCTFFHSKDVRESAF